MGTKVFEELLGKTISRIEKRQDEMVMQMTDGSRVWFYHSQNCCESVDIEDVIGDLDDLVGQPLRMAERETSGANPPDVEKDYQDSFTWTFYKFATINGYVTVRWYGESNGYYSESVSAEMVSPDGERTVIDDGREA